MNLGNFIIGQDVKYRQNFHNDQGTLEDPTLPEAQLEKPDNTFVILVTPAIVNGKTGHFGGTIPTTGLAVGQYLIRMQGTVATAKIQATEFNFTIEDPDIYKFNPETALLEGAETYAETFRIIRSFACGILTKAGNVLSFWNKANTKERIIGTTNADNERSNITTDGT